MWYARHLVRIRGINPGLGQDGGRDGNNLAAQYRVAQCDVLLISRGLLCGNPSVEEGESRGYSCREPGDAAPERRACEERDWWRQTRDRNQSRKVGNVTGYCTGAISEARPTDEEGAGYSRG